ncbi:MAG: dialkylresorcinol condensing enzyme [Candidatus Thiodiazotropha sp. (ex Lucinoma kastoroae)]|nr:dialkylresorcinol condensing enzyme [Candidatus Thiodiazotropha sp. (ex Rostrolucina anterorostrata)]MCU7850247.1 dialkylresorcinol condensing enzyme [Candidatus Thiodiazotropha sp. (ex Lucinoma kastoroae)]
MKKVLVIQYSQTGQLSRVVESICEPLAKSEDIELFTETLVPVIPYPYPWSFFGFLDVFPECVALDAPDNKPLSIDIEEDFDLVILAYQVWFLAPSLPVTAFLKSESGKCLLNGKPVVTVIGCRNMWSQAQETVKKLLIASSAKLIDNIVLTDQGSTLDSFITTPRWLLTGKKDAFWRFPPAGISQLDIDRACRFGHALAQGLTKISAKIDAPLLTGLQAVKADLSQIQSEKAGIKSFTIWGRLLRKVGCSGDFRRKPILVLYLVFLVILILSVVPLTVLLKKTLSPFLVNKYQKIKQYYELPSGSGSERMNNFDC